MLLEDLRPGDIIFVRNGQYDFVHMGICIESGGTFSTTKMAHTLGKMHPYCLVATHLAPRHILEEKDLHYVTIRPGPNVKIATALDVLHKWLQCAVPYDSRKYDKLVEVAENKDIIGSEGSLNNYSERERALLIERAIQAQNELFNYNKYSLISLAATRNIGPTAPMPLTADRIAEGIICTSPIIMSLQIAALSDDVAPVESFWVSDLDVAPRELEVLLNSDHEVHAEYLAYIERLQSGRNCENELKFHSSLRLLKRPLEELNFDQIQPGLRVDPNLCPVSVLYFSLLQDNKNFIDMGVLVVPNCAEFEQLRASFIDNVASLITEANRIRSTLYKQLNFDSAYNTYNRTYEEVKKEIVTRSSRFTNRL